MKCDCRRRPAILTCVACHGMFCTYCIQFSDHSCTKSKEKIASEKEKFRETLLKSGVSEVKLERI